MSNDKLGATFGRGRKRPPEKEVTYFDPNPDALNPLQSRPVTAAHAARPVGPLWARIAAGALLGLVLVVWPVSCTASGIAYERCVEEKVAETGFDTPTQAIIDACR